MRIAVTVANAVRSGADISLSVELRLAADPPTDPPRRSFVVVVSPQVTLAELREALLERVRREVLSYQEEQDRSAALNAKVAALAGRTWVVEV